MTRHTITISVARTRGGRALLHALCLARGRNLRWHVGGIVRELFGRHPRSSRGRCQLPTFKFWLLVACLVLPGLRLVSPTGASAASLTS